jgi:Transglycosylase SLT domain/Domain of unknown function (DUF4124)
VTPNPLKIGIWIASLLTMTVGLWMPSPAAGDIYRFQDEEGVVYFSNVPTNPKYRLFFKEIDHRGPVSKGGDRKAFSAKSLNSEGPALLSTHIDEASQQYQVDPKLVQAVIRVESNFDPQAVSPKGAQGLMQLMPQTARDLQVTDPFSPKENISGGVRYLRYLLDLFNQDISLALAAYNAGPEKVALYRGIPPYPETQTYVQKVIQTYNRLKSHILSSW